MRRNRSALIVLALALWPAGAAVRSRAGGPASEFRAGEQLAYQVGWLGMPQAATAELEVLSQLDFYGRTACHFRALAHTENPLRLLLALDDQFDSYDDAKTLATRRYEEYLDERGKRTVQASSLNERTPGAVLFPAPAGTRDPLAMLYAMRANDWRRRPELRSPIFDGNRFYEAEARITAAHDRVSVPAGSYDASRVAVSVSSPSGTSISLTVWLANDRARTPVELDAELPIGRVTALLLRVE